MKIKTIINAIVWEIAPIAVLLSLLPLGYLAFSWGASTVRPATVESSAVFEQNALAEKIESPEKIISTPESASAAPAETELKIIAANKEEKPAKPKIEIAEKPAPILAKRLIKAAITETAGLVPNDYTVKAGVPVRFEINPEVDGEGCMSTIMIEGLYEKPFLIKRGKKIVMEFTPEKPGDYYFICAMGVEWGKITVIA